MDKFIIRKKQEPVTCPCPHSPQASTSNVDAKEQDEAHDSDSASEYKGAWEKHEDLGKWIKPSSHGQMPGDDSNQSK
ncbi:unnamed protein product [Acanthoscelides obtectus]|uniref:Uncharacterized protein n=1 Tax=Acanthoscelides obtectus TaxID=200917 RepID=A0A9P0PRX8_ACAOB|nr:unnamed protein product [Acanthoscelides obtectus]CAK1668221.1 hypothetical protein AOBTE_LOCUS26288 [Acanthoscelides obtectus]